MKSNPRSRWFHPRLRLLLVAAPACLLLGGCIAGWNARRSHDANSVVQFLYPDTDQPFIQPEVPTLRLPLRIGVAFVPSGTSGAPANFRPGRFDETAKTELLKKVAAQFQGLPFVRSIEIIPATYLRPGGSFENLDQLHAMLGIDVAVLVSYDQAQNSRDNEWSLAYWTIVGAYVVPAQKNETHTLMEAVVYDIPSRALLFRAPGTSSVGGHSTPFRSERELEADAHAGFALAATDMTTHLQQELAAFKVRIREQPETVRIEHRPGYTGGGSLDVVFVVVLLVLGTLAVRACRK